MEAKFTSHEIETFLTLHKYLKLLGESKDFISFICNDGCCKFKRFRKSNREKEFEVVSFKKHQQN